MNFKSTVFSMSAALALFANSGCGGSASAGGGSIGTFNDALVSRDDYYKKLETMQVVRVVDANGNVVQARLAEPLSSQALQVIMTEQAVLQAARDEKVLPTADDVEKEKKFREDLQQGYVNELKKLGLSMSDIHRNLTLELAQENLTVRGIPEKTMEDVDKYIESNPNVTRVPATATLRLVVVETAEEQARVDEQLRNGIPFGSVASLYSKLPNARMNNGAFPDSGTQPRAIPIERLPKEMQDAVKKTGDGRISDWFTTGNQKVKIFVEAKTPETRTTLTNAQKERLRRDLRIQEGRIQNDVQKLIVEKLSKAEVKVTVDYMKQAWELFQKAVKERSADILGHPSPGEKQKSTTEEQPKAK